MNWITSSILCFFSRFSEPDSNFLDLFADDMASIFEHYCSRRLDEKNKIQRSTHYSLYIQFAVIVNELKKNTNDYYLPLGPQRLASPGSGCLAAVRSVHHAQRDTRPIGHQDDRRRRVKTWDRSNLGDKTTSIQRPGNHFLLG